MAIHVGIEHYTRYLYDRPIRMSPHLIRLRPAPHARTPIHDYQLKIEPAEHHLHWQQDPFGNQIARIIFPEPVTEFVVDVQLVAEMTVINPFDFFVEDYAEKFPFDYEPLQHHELAPYFELTDNGPLLADWIAGIDLTPRRCVDFLVYINSKLQADIGYNIRMEVGIQTCEETLKMRTGSCRDTAWLLVQILRHIGLAARFVSGYLVQLTPDEKSLDGPSGTDHDFTDLHAWTEVYIPGAGWIGLDPTSGLFAGEGHIPLACTPDPVSAAPVTGASDKCEVTFEFRNVVTRVHEDPRVTKPYTDDQWESICTLGRQVDKELNELDVRLTMGGEPTFVSIDDMDGAQWNTEALGVHKRERAGVLLKRLKDSFAHGALLHYGEGKWYPGEPLPRWALGCFWRNDGIPLWRDERLIADETRPTNVTVHDAERFGQVVASKMGIDSRFLIAAREDWLYYLWRESQQQVGADNIVIPWARQYRDDLSLALARGLDKAIGYALPMRYDWSRDRWRSGTWTFPRGEMFLMPGGSPMGLRLPLGQLPWAIEELVEYDYIAPSIEPPQHDGGIGTATAPPAADAKPETVRAYFKQMMEVPYTALCIEPRNGHLYVFMPRLENFDHFAELLAAIEDTAAELQLPVLIEGYEPPDSPQLDSLKVTPDPGVIEVNIQPADNWDDLQQNTVTLYEQARLSRLATEKFMLDGRHTGTGGGNHVTLGAEQPSDSPFLRRPDLLRSLITYWQHHPSLSYLFSGLFIGPTSQAPRIDERGNHLLDELEVSLGEIETGVSPIELDYSLRSFLADLTGNTHRAEFCIDKLYPADRPKGRLGLLEFRAFEMPPHSQMSLAQMLLLRALIAKFWRKPYRHRLVRWGTALHDRFMLPHYVRSDFQSVMQELAEDGYPFELGWYEPFFEFRFPVYGRVQYGGVELELRMALEPWLVLDEEDGAQRQARVVDSAVERLEIICRGLDPKRYRVTCNRRSLPLHETGAANEYVAGVRFKAWKAAFGLHPTIDMHAPLVFDVFDIQLGRSIGGCVYHVSHPGGLGYETFPVNAFEAEARRMSRFWSWGHSAGDPPRPKWVDQLKDYYAELPPLGHRDPASKINSDYPHTLDLRREYKS
ncbi:transglutaminase family protein [Novipirellula caenicola]|uniref:transglutaminase family protein n=1 Tax=Novipirellula caenicola TaxID=1536901 RepID=UPI0031EDB9F1